MDGACQAGHKTPLPRLDAGALMADHQHVVMISSMGFLYAKLFHQNVAAYFPFLTVGLVTWTLLASMITEGIGVFTGAQGVIQSVPMPYSIHVYRLVYRNLLVFGHSFVIVPIVLMFFGVPIGWRALLAIPALLVLAINGAWCTIFFGMLSARYRDVPPIVSSFVNVVFFVTPIMWPPSALGNWARLGITESAISQGSMSCVRRSLVSRWARIPGPCCC